jgi:hypothetical protein
MYAVLNTLYGVTHVWYLISSKKKKSVQEINKLKIVFNIFT